MVRLFAAAWPNTWTKADAATDFDDLEVAGVAR